MKRNDGTKGYVASSYLNYSAAKPAPTPTHPVANEPDYSEYTETFVDFNTTAWWRDDMVWAIDRGIIEGYGKAWNEKTKKYEKQLQPNAQLTEAHFLTIFFRYAQKDVKNTSSWNRSGLYNMAKKYKMPVLATEESTTSKALANKGIRRGKLAQLMASYHYEKTVSEKEAIQFFLDNGITTATSIVDYRPDEILTRAQIFAFIQRYDSFVSKQK